MAVEYAPGLLFTELWAAKDVSNKLASEMMEERINAASANIWKTLGWKHPAHLEAGAFIAMRKQ